MRHAQVFCWETALLWSGVAAAASPPAPATSIAPDFITVVGTRNGVPDPAGAFTVTVRDADSQPIAGTAVRLVFAGCSDVRPAAVQPLAGLSVDCATSTVSATTDVQGMAHFDIVGAVIRRTPASGRGCVELRADPGNVLLGTATAACVDQDGFNGTTSCDVGLVTADLSLLTYSGRSDLDHSGSIDLNDVATETGLMSAGNSAASGARCDGLPAMPVTIESNAHALDLAWNRCRPQGGDGTVSFSCPTTGGNLPVLVGSIVAPGGLDAVTGFDAVVEIVCEPGTSLPPWWQFQPGGCRAGKLTVAPSQDAFCEALPGGGTMSARIVYPAGAPHVERIEIGMRDGNAGALTAATAYSLFDVKIQKPPLLSADCAGCATPVLLRFVSLTLKQDSCQEAPTRPDVHMIVPAQDNVVTAQGPVLGVAPHGAPTGLALWHAGAHPAHGVLTVGFALPTWGSARLTLLDVAGRAITTNDVGGLGAGTHRVTLAAAGTLPPGVYSVRLEQAGRTRTLKAAVLP